MITIQSLNGDISCGHRVVCRIALSLPAVSFLLRLTCFGDSTAAGRLSGTGMLSVSAPSKCACLQRKQQTASVAR